MVSRRFFLGVSLASVGVGACGRRGSPGYPGYAFVANQEGRAVAAVDLQALVVVRHIPLEGAPTQILASQSRPSIYALAPEEGMVFEIDSDRLALKRSVKVGPAIGMTIDKPEKSLFVLTREPKALVRVSLDSFVVEKTVALPEMPVQFAVAPDAK